VNNPSAADKKAGIYRPRMTLMKRMTKKGDEIPLKIEFSVAKILHSNNVDEVEESDFESVITALQDNMLIMQVLVEKEDLRNAIVTAFHPSKNILLTSGYTSPFVIKELNKIDVSKKMDLNRDSFRNSGQSLQLYTNSHSLVFYDKVHDMKKPEKRAMDKDQNWVQETLFDNIIKKEQPEILRIEARLAKKPKMNALLKKLGLKQSPTFKDVFNKNMCQTILLDYWNQLIVGKNLFLFDVDSSPKKTFDDIFKNKPNISPKEALYLLGLRIMSKEGIRETRAIIEQYAHTRTWYRIAEDLPFLDAISGKTYHGWVQQINNSLNDFTPFRLPTKSLEEYKEIIK